MSDLMGVLVTCACLAAFVSEKYGAEDVAHTGYCFFKLTRKVIRRVELQFCKRLVFWSNNQVRGVLRQ